MAEKIVHLIFPQTLVKEPVIYNMAVKCKVVPNIRRAKVTEEVGEVTLELSGTEEALDEARKYLEERGVRCEPVVGDIVR